MSENNLSDELNNQSKDISSSISIIDEEKDKIKDLAENEVLTDKLIILFGIFIALSIAIIGHAGYSIVNMLTDKSIPVVVCPRNYELDAPVVMPTIKDSSIKVTDMWIRGFIRRFVTYQMPRKGAEVQKFFDYIVNHTEEGSSINLKYLGMRDDFKSIAEYVEHGNYKMFYPVSSNESVRIRKKSDNEWAVEIDGYLVKRENGNEQRHSPTLKYIVKAGPANINNPEGLYVSETTTEEVIDYVSGTTKNIN